jgi:hypothetical protein
MSRIATAALVVVALVVFGSVAYVRHRYGFLNSLLAILPAAILLAVALRVIVLLDVRPRSDDR